MDISEHTYAALAAELGRRDRAAEEAKQAAIARAKLFERSDAVATALRACATALETGVYRRDSNISDPMHENIVDRAGKMAKQLAYNTLSGGGHDPSSGMNAGWEAEGFGAEPDLNAKRDERRAYREPIDAVLSLCDPDHAEHIRNNTGYF